MCTFISIRRLRYGHSIKQRRRDRTSHLHRRVHVINNRATRPNDIEPQNGGQRKKVQKFSYLNFIFHSFQYLKIKIIQNYFLLLAYTIQTFPENLKSLSQFRLFVDYESVSQDFFYIHTYCINNNKKKKTSCENL